MDDKKIKSKPKKVRTADNAPKTASKHNAAVINGAEILKKQFIKSKAELHTDEQTETPEEYATNTVEGRAASATDTTVNAVNKTAHRSVQKIKGRIKNRDTETESPDIETACQQSVPVKNPETTVSVDAKEPKYDSVKIKTKEEYLESGGDSVLHIKSDKVYHSKQQNIQPKTRQMMQDKQTINAPDGRQQAAKKYVENKLKARAVGEKRAETQHGLGIKHQGEVQQAPSQKPKLQDNMKHEIKTKDNYIRTQTRPGIRSDGTLKEKTILQEKQIIKERVPSAHTIKTKSAVKNTIPSNRTVKTGKSVANKSVKTVVKTQKQATKKVAKQAAKRTKELARRTAQATKATAKATVRIAKVVMQATVAAAKAIISAIATGGATAVILVILIIIIIIAAVIASPFGIFVSEEVTDPGTVPLSQIIAEYNVELTQQVEDIELSVDHTSVGVVDNQTDTNIVLAVFAAKTAGAEDDTAEDVVVFDAVKAEKLKEYFRAANSITYTVDEMTDTEGNVTESNLAITIIGKTKEQLMDDYSLSAKQCEVVETLLEETDVLMASSHSLVVTDANVQAIVNSLPDTLPEKRKDVVRNAASLVGKVNYFWGGKSSAIGWDSAWGTMRKVTSAGSPSSGSIRAFGLDCSGFVTWVFNNSGMGYSVGHGTMGQKAVSTVVSSVQAGDLAFLPDYSHVGIVVGKDTGGNILVIHCSSGANNVVLSTASSVGFTVFRKPNCY